MHLFGDSWARFCATEPIQRDCGIAMRVQRYVYCNECAAMCAIFCIGIVGAIAVGVYAPLWRVFVAKADFAEGPIGPSPGKGKGPFGRAGLRENLRPGGEPGLTQGGGVRCLILGGAPVRTALG